MEHTKQDSGESRDDFRGGNRRNQHRRNVEDMDVPESVKDLDVLLRHQRNLLQDIATRATSQVIPLANDNPLWQKLNAQRRPDLDTLWHAFAENLEEIGRLSVASKEALDRPS